ncbi:uncharacterized protein LOC120331592 [Styela clava]
MWTNKNLQKSKQCKEILENKLFLHPQDLKSWIDVDNVFIVYNLSKTCNHVNTSSIKGEVHIFMRENFENITENEEWNKLEVDDVLSILGDPEVICTSEKVKWEAVLKWVKHEHSRTNLFPNLFKLLDLTLFSAQFIQEIIKRDKLVKESPECIKLISDEGLQNNESNNNSMGKTDKKDEKSFSNGSTSRAAENLQTHNMLKFFQSITLHPKREVRQSRSQISKPTTNDKISMEVCPIQSGDRSRNDDFSLDHQATSCNASAVESSEHCNSESSHPHWQWPPPHHPHGFPPHHPPPHHRHPPSPHHPPPHPGHPPPPHHPPPHHRHSPPPHHPPPHHRHPPPPHHPPPHHRHSPPPHHPPPHHRHSPPPHHPPPHPGHPHFPGRGWRRHHHHHRPGGFGPPGRGRWRFPMRGRRTPPTREEWNDYVEVMERTLFDDATEEH